MRIKFYILSAQYLPVIDGYYIEQCRFIEHFCHHGKFYWTKLFYIKRLKPTQATEIHPIPKHLFIEQYSFTGSSQVVLVVKNLPANAGSKEKWVWSLGWEDPLAEGMATHSSLLAWRTPWTEEPGGLQCMGSQGVGHDWSNLARSHTSR